MATPTLVTVNGDLSPVLLAKQITFKIPSRLHRTGSPDVILPSTIEAEVAPDGTFTVQLYGTNDPAWNPSNWTYQVTIIGDDLKDQFYISVPYNAGSIDFGDLLPAVPASEGSLYAAYHHTHEIDDVNDLQVQLDGKQPAGSYLVPDDISNLVSTTTLNEALAFYLTIAAANARGNLLTTGEEILPRDDVAGEVALVSGVAYFSFFTARKTETITTVRTATGATAASGLTLARIGIYSTDGTTLTPVASTANDTALWNATNTMFPKTFTAAWNKVAGQRYAQCLLAVGTTMPILEGVQVRPNSVGLAPRIQGELSGQSNLPAGPTEASLSSGFRRFQGIYIP